MGIEYNLNLFALEDIGAILTMEVVYTIHIFENKDPKAIEKPIMSRNTSVFIHHSNISLLKLDNY
jgi:hypothetical protein